MEFFKEIKEAFAVIGEHKGAALTILIGGLVVGGVATGWRDKGALDAKDGALQAKDATLETMQARLDFANARNAANDPSRLTPEAVAPGPAQPPPPVAEVKPSPFGPAEPKPKPVTPAPAISADVLSIYQSGGQTAHTINNYAPPKRCLSGDQRTAFVDVLRRAGPQRADIVTTSQSGEEGAHFSECIAKALRDAGWKTSTGSFLMPPWKLSGVELHYIKTEPPPGAAALVEAFRAAGIGTEVHGEVAHRGAVAIVVGLPPS